MFTYYTFLLQYHFLVQV